MADPVGTLSVRIVADAEQFKKSLAQTTGSLKHLQDASSRVALASAASFAVLGTGVVKAAKTFADFDRSMVRVGALTNAGGQAFADLEGTARSLAATTEFSARQVADGMGFMAMAGFDAAGIMSAMPSSLKLASAGMIDVASASDIVTNIMAGMGIESDQLGSAVDTLVSAMSGANVDTRSLGEAFKYVGPVARGAGVSFNEVTAAIALLGNAGIQGSMAGTTLRGAISHLLNPTEAAATAMKQIGLTALDSSGKFVGFQSVVQQLESALASGLVNESQLAALSLEIFGQRAGPGMMALVGQGSAALDKFTQRLESSGGVADRISSKVLNSFAGQMTITKSKIEEATLGISRGMVPILKSLNRMLQGAIDTFNRLNPAVKRVLGASLVLSTGLAALVAKFALLLAYGPQIIRTFNLFGQAAKRALVTSILPMLPAIAAIGAAIAAVVLAVGFFKRAWDQNLGGIQEKIAAVGDTIKTAFTESIDWAIEKLAALVTSARRTWEELRAAFTGTEINVVPTTTAADVRASAGGVASSVSNAASSALDTAAPMFDELSRSWSAGTGVFKSLINEVGLFSGSSRGARRELGGVAPAAVDVDDALSGLTEAVIDGESAFTQNNNTMARLDQIINSGLEDIGTANQARRDELARASEEAAASLRGAASSMASQLVGSMGDAGSVVSAALQGASQGGIWGAILGTVMSIAQQSESYKRASQALNKILEGVVKAFEPLLEGLEPFTLVVNGVVGVLVKVLTPVLKALGTVLSWFGRAVALVVVGIGGVLIGISKVWNFIVDKIEWVFEQIDKIPGVNMSRAIDALENLQIDTDELSDGIEDFAAIARGENLNLPDVVDESDNAANSLARLGDTADSVTAQILNVPTGFKVALARFNATSVDTAAAPDFGVSNVAAPAAQTTKPIAIDTVVVQANDVGELERQIREIQERRNLAASGSTLSPTMPRMRL